MAPVKKDTAHVARDGDWRDGSPMGDWEYRRACRGDRREARQAWSAQEISRPNFKMAATRIFDRLLMVFMTAMRVRQGLGKDIRTDVNIIRSSAA